MSELTLKERIGKWQEKIGKCPYFFKVNLHLQNRSLGWGSGGAKRHSTSIRSSISRAKLVNSPRCISLHTNSSNPLLRRASWVGQLGIVMLTSFSFSSISYPTRIAQV